MASGQMILFTASLTIFILPERLIGHGLQNIDTKSKEKKKKTKTKQVVRLRVRKIFANQLSWWLAGCNGMVTCN